MTKEQLMTLEHVEVRETKDFIHLHTDEGYYITEWQGGDDITDFNASECWYIPLMEEYPNFRVLNAEEYNHLDAEAEKKREEDAVQH